MNFQMIGIAGFDELLESLPERCGSRRDVPTPPTTRGEQPAEGQPFDMSRVPASLDEIDWARGQTVLVTYCKTMSIALPPQLDRRFRCRREIAAIKALLLAGHPEVEGLCLALADWSQELRMILRLE